MLSMNNQASLQRVMPQYKKRKKSVTFLDDLAL